MVNAADRISLLPHQLQAVQKLKGVKGRFIGDEMRVGKTPTAIQLDLEDRKKVGRKQRGNNCTLIVAPKSGLGVWSSHLARMGIEQENIFVVDLPTRKNLVETLQAIAKVKRLADAPARYVVINYDSVHPARKDIWRAGPWFHVIGDEIHSIKTPTIQRTKAFKKTATKYKTALSGTPADDKPEDFQSPLHWLYPTEPYFRSRNRFIRWICNVTKKDRWGHEIKEGEPGYDDEESGYYQIEGVNERGLAEFHAKIRPFYIRRRFADVADFLPIVQRQVVYVEMGARQRKEYDNVSRDGITELESYTDGIPIDLLTPSQVEKLVRLQQMAIGVCRSDWTTKRRRNKDTGEMEEKPFQEVTITDKPPSPKIDYIMDWLKDNDGAKLGVFAQHHATVSRTVERLTSKGIEVSALTGRDGTADRDRAIGRFQDGSSQVFVGTIGACRQAIDLSMANTGIVLDRVWNPSWGEQLESRILNLNSQDPKTWIYLEARNSVDQYRAKRIADKAHNIDMVVNVD